MVHSPMAAFSTNPSDHQFPTEISDNVALFIPANRKCQCNEGNEKDYTHPLICVECGHWTHSQCAFLLPQTQRDEYESSVGPLTDSNVLYHDGTYVTVNKLLHVMCRACMDTTLEGTQCSCNKSEDGQKEFFWSSCQHLNVQLSFNHRCNNCKEPVHFQCSVPIPNNPIDHPVWHSLLLCHRCHYKNIVKATIAKTNDTFSHVMYEFPTSKLAARTCDLLGSRIAKVAGLEDDSYLSHLSRGKVATKMEPEHHLITPQDFNNLVDSTSNNFNPVAPVRMTKQDDVAGTTQPTWTENAVDLLGRWMQRNSLYKDGAFQTIQE
jgi:hypothetical protein